MSESHPQDHDTSIVALREFIQATRDSGYKGTSSAVAELIDNSLQAGARHIRLRLSPGSDAADAPILLSVQDDGEGMSPLQLQQALRFGGSSRFDSRAGLGRYGMGLPNSSLSQARRVEVYSWPPREPIHRCYLDLDEITAGSMVQVPKPRLSPLPGWAAAPGRSGTLVVWHTCDRLDYRYPARQLRRLHTDLGRIFRHFIWDGVEISLNEVPLQASDPLFLDPRSTTVGASPYGEPLVYELCLPCSGKEISGRVQVRFSELPVQAWQRLSNAEKGRLGITKGGGVSVVRAGREIDYGWFFMGSKRRENYDDWWRCELSFGPELDDIFGMTHTKQQIRPSLDLVAALSPDLEAIGRALNARVRRAHQAAKSRERYAGAERRIAAAASRMEPLAAVKQVAAQDSPLLQRLVVLYPELTLPAEEGQLEHRLVEEDLADAGLYEVLRLPGRIVVVLNTAHPFYQQAYAPLVGAEVHEAAARREQLEVLFLSLARAEVGSSAAAGAHLQRFRRAWSDVLAEVLRG